ncbi:MAG: hypothetical protein JSS75_01685 [Bacteroidetes bacterium]|nr:hypothetical protein [Bacteroidota bacterium]
MRRTILHAAFSDAVRQRTASLCVALLILFGSASLVHAQIPFLGILGAGHPELRWYQIETAHFVIVYHNGLDSIAERAAPIAEEAYRVVTTNLHTPLSKKVTIYFSDNDEVKNAFAFNDDHIFIWMRGILDDLPYGIRSSGNAKWLRTVITHEFTHIAVAHATKDWTSFVFPGTNVPRWFNEGLARTMEPDGYTPDLDQLMRVATVYDELDLGGSDNYFAGTMAYEAGHSFIRYLLAQFGPTVIQKLLDFRDGAGAFDFEKAFRDATKKPLRDVYDEWHKTMTVYYASGYGARSETNEFGRKLPCEVPVVLAARIAPHDNRIALIGRRTAHSGARLYLMQHDTVGTVELLSDEPGIEPYLSWDSDGRSVVVSKLRIGTNGDLLHDLYRVEIANGSMTRLTDDGRFEEPDVAPNGDVVAVHTTKGHSDLVIIHPDGSQTMLTHYDDPNVQVYTPRYSPDGKQVAYSLFYRNGSRSISFVSVAGAGKANASLRDVSCRQPVWYGEGGMAYTKVNSNGFSVWMSPPGGDLIHGTYPTAAGGVMAWDYSPWKDSLLVTSFDRRSSIPLYWISNRGTTGVRDTLALMPKYTAWHDTHFPLLPRPEDSLPQITALSPSSYNSLLHIQPLVFLPVLQSDKGSDARPGLRYGLTSILTDPMQKHQFVLFADYGDHSHRFGGYAQYTNAQLDFPVLVTLSDLFGYDRVIAGLPLYQHTQEIGLATQYTFHAPNALDVAHVVSLEGALRRMEPRNNGRIFDSLSDVNHRPIDIRYMQSNIRYRFLSPSTTISASLELGSPTDDQTQRFERVDLSVAHHFSFNEDRTVYLGLRGLATAQFGMQIPQDYVGFTTDEVFEQGFNPNSLRPPTRLRGIRRAYYGDRLVLGSAEIVFPDRIFSSLTPLIGVLKPAFVGFFDMGSVWYNATPTNFLPVVTTSLAQTQWLKSYGVELRVGSEGALTAAFGLGYEVKMHPAPDWYFRLNTGL